MAKKTRTKHSKKKLGQAPGSAIYTGERTKEKLFIEAFDYNTSHCIVKELNSVEESYNFKNSDSVTWVNLNGLNHVNAIESLGNHFNLHPLVVEDIVSISQRPKLDDYGEYLFVVLKMLYYKDDDEENIISEQVSFVLGKNYVLTFQESEGDVFDAVRARIIAGRGRARSLGSDYLLYILVDAIVDHYFSVIELLGDKVEDFENAIFSGNVDDQTSKKIRDLKHEILRMRRSIFPLREILIKIDKNENPLIEKKTITFFRDIYDHLIQVSESIDIYREMASSLMDMYMTAISNKMNEVMKVLTIMASIFIPLTFIAGVYGMNFEYMPELNYKYGYIVVWGVMIAMFLAMLYYFKRKKWL
ncbi:magnesium/cobalt transporter CorA [Tamlana sp. s12]|uniref:magnesium/cobalt transporter CorA n=1 Tax=Tamlana sp. s12 TaxID=1630406 RepID=UPI0007FBB6C5|nr:magnesium/cobalt transporter CorA [Tamlana sp. s12]OBQ52845.1 magnesium transporter [Tamlana sp. s12]QQY81130.1 magnesium/cobalt transporter CorA [Tamlana sp. s12]